MEYENENYPRKILYSLERLRRGDALCDVELTSGDTVFMAHRALLAAACPYFEAMFTSGLQESQRASVCLPTVPPHVLNLILHFIYTGRVCMSDSVLQELIVAADMLQLEELVATCADHLKQHLEPSNALGIYRFAEAHNWGDLERDAMRYAVAHLGAVSEGQELLELPLPLLLQLMSSDESEDKDETEVLRAALRWLEHEPASRSSHALQVLRGVRLRRIPSCVLQDSLNAIRSPAVADTLGAFIAVLEPVECDGMGNTRPHLYVVGGFVDGSRTPTALKYDIYKRSWEKIAPMKKARATCAVAAAGGLLYAVGGVGGNDQPLDTGEVYDPATNRWSNIAPMQSARYGLGLVALGGKLYAFGGNLDTHLFSSVEEYDMVTDRWSAVGAMPEQRRDMHVVAYKGAAYVVGGRVKSEDGWKESADLLRFEPTRRQWRRLAPMAHERWGAVAVLDVKSMHLYVLGGRRPGRCVDVVERYNFAKDEWNEMERMRKGRRLFAAGAADGVLIAAGGIDSYDHDTASVELYEVAQRRGTEGVAMPQTRRRAASAVIWTLPQMASAATACLSEFMERVPTTPED